MNEKPVDGDRYGWDEFVIWCEQEGIGEDEEDWIDWWDCWVASRVTSK